MRRNGFSIIELMLAIVISSLLLGLLYQIFNQIRLGVQRTERSVTITLTIARLEDILRNDLSCAYIPRQFEEKESSQLKNLFFSQNEQKRLKRLSFISTNALGSYAENSAQGVRIRYSLEPSDSSPDLFTLKRQQSTNFDLKPFEQGQVRAYLVADRIKEMSTTFMVLKKPKEGEKSTEPRYDEYQQWGDSIKENVLLPDAILIKGTVVDQRMQEHAFEMRCMIASRPFSALKKVETQTVTTTASTATAVSQPQAAPPRGAP